MLSLSRILATILSLSVASCANSDPKSTERPRATKPVQLLLSVARTGSTDSGSREEVTALVGVLRLPATANARQIARLVGLDLNLPDLQHCEVANASLEGHGSLAGMVQVEFLDIGNVTLSSGRRSIRLTRQAFPTIADFISGVVYTNRDPSASLFGKSPNFELRARGGSGIPTFSVPGECPPPLSNVTLDRTPLAEIERWSNGQATTLAWTPGSEPDVVWVSIEPTSGNASVVCAFPDASGFGVIPPGMLKAGGVDRITLHRLRTVEVRLIGISNTELRLERALTHTFVQE